MSHVAKSFTSSCYCTKARTLNQESAQTNAQPHFAGHFARMHTLPWGLNFIKYKLDPQMPFPITTCSKSKQRDWLKIWQSMNIITHLSHHKLKTLNEFNCYLQRIRRPCKLIELVTFCNLFLHYSVIIIISSHDVGDSHDKLVWSWCRA